MCTRPVRGNDKAAIRDPFGLLFLRERVLADPLFDRL
jgi:hypothetical protein